jgi:alpha-beta hydrolase superfamily lysophospholipase
MVKRSVKKALILLIGLYIMIGTSLYLLQEKILFRPTVLAQDYVYTFDSNFEELFLKPNDDAIINALHFKAENPKGVILYFHGNAGDLSRWGIITEYFVGMNYDVLVMDYRTYGKSTGPLNEAALYQDAQFCYDYLKDQYRESQITVYGRSLGTGIASYITSKNNPKQLILETPFYNLEDVAKHRFPIFPMKYAMRYQFASHEYIAQTRCPIAIVHGTEDRVVPFLSGKKLFEAAPHALATFTVVENGNHNNLIQFDAYHRMIDTLLR